MQAVIRCGLRSDVSPAMRDQAWEFVRQWASPSPRDPVHGQWRPREPRPRDAVVAALREALPQILKAGDIGAMGQMVAAEMGIDEAYASLVAVLENESLAPALRARAMGALAKADEALLNRAIEAGLESGEPVVRIAARQLLAQRFPARAVEQLRDAVNDGHASRATGGDRYAGAARLAGDPRSYRSLLDRVEDGSCPPGLVLDVLEAAARSSDAAIVERQKAYNQRIAGTTPLAVFAACLEGGDAAQRPANL